MMTFSGLRRDIKTHIPFTGNKISVRADLMHTFWMKISAQINEAGFNRNSDKNMHIDGFEPSTIDVPGLKKYSIRIAGKAFKWKVDYHVSMDALGWRYRFAG